MERGDGGKLLNEFGIKVLRIRNEELKDLEAVLTQIEYFLEAKEFSSPPAPLHKWRGETSVASRREARDGERIFLSASGEEDKQMKENSHSITVGVTRMRHSCEGILPRKHFV